MGRVNMKTFLVAFTLLMLSLHGNQADKGTTPSTPTPTNTSIGSSVTSCLKCNSMEDPECIEGTGKGTECGMWNQIRPHEGCVVTRFQGEYDGVEVTFWERECCMTESSAPDDGVLGSCTEFHGEYFDYEDGLSGYVDQTWCGTNDCNTGDPGNSASALVPAFTFLL